MDREQTIRNTVMRIVEKQPKVTWLMFLLLMTSAITTCYGIYHLRFTDPYPVYMRYVTRSGSIRVPTITTLRTTSVTSTRITTKPTSIVRTSTAKLQMTPHGFRYLINNESICKSTKSLFYVIYVESAPNNFVKRTQIRETWGYKNMLRDKSGKVVFLLGTTKDTDVQEGIEEESKLYRDIVQLDFVDSYFNLTVKSVMALKWVKDFCYNAEFAMKADDDTLVNLPGLVRFLTIMARRARDTFFCYVWPSSLVERKGKWNVPYHQFGEERYPRGCNGPFYILPKSRILDLYKQSYHVPYIPVEDQYVTGLLARAVGGLKHVSPAGFVTYPWGLSLDFYTNATVPPPLISVPKDEIYLLAWKATIDRISKHSKNLLSETYRIHFKKTFPGLS